MHKRGVLIEKWNKKMGHNKGFDLDIVNNFLYWWLSYVGQ